MIDAQTLYEEATNALVLHVGMKSFTDAKTDPSAYAVDKLADAWLYGRAFAILRIHRQMLQMQHLPGCLYRRWFRGSMLAIQDSLKTD